MRETKSPTPGERILAALGHISILLMGVGIFAPALIWVIKRRKSTYTSFQALQALGFEVFFTFYATLIVLVLLIVLILLVFVGTEYKVAAAEWTSIVNIGVVVLSIGLIGMYLLVGIVGALACLFGKEFRYPFLGKRLAAYLRQDSAEGIDQEHEDRYVAAMGHAGVMIQFLGIAAPLIAWLACKGRSQLLHFQSLQALVFQASGIAIWSAFSLILVGFFGLVLVLVTMGDKLPAMTIGAVDGFSIALGVISFILILIFMLFWPLLSTLGLVASYRLLKGRDYEYPLVGKWVKQWA